MRSLKFDEFIAQSSSPARWDGVTKLPWGDPAFSERMLREHLSQSHDGASRRIATVERHVRWIHEQALRGATSRILDLGCGPGLYTQRLAALGHACVGMDIAPAAIEYARAQSAHLTQPPRYVLGDMASVQINERFDMVMIIHGELKVFAPHDAEAILRNARSMLDAGGRILLEVHPAGAVEAIGRRPRTWSAAANGLFGDRPYVRMDESRWDETTMRATNLHWIIDAGTGDVRRFGTVTQAYRDAAYDDLLARAGFREVTRAPSLAGDDADPSYIVRLASA